MSQALCPFLLKSTLPPQLAVDSWIKQSQQFTGNKPTILSDDIVVVHWSQVWESVNMCHAQDKRARPFEVMHEPVIYTCDFIFDFIQWQTFLSFSMRPHSASKNKIKVKCWFLVAENLKFEFHIRLFCIIPIYTSLWTWSNAFKTLNKLLFAHEITEVKTSAWVSVFVL